MGLIKIEYDLPDFKDELSFTITIKRDGEVISSSSPEVNLSEKEDQKKKKENVSTDKFGEESVVVEKTEKVPQKTASKKLGGNMMNLEI